MADSKNQELFCCLNGYVIRLLYLSDSNGLVPDSTCPLYWIVIVKSQDAVHRSAPFSLMYTISSDSHWVSESPVCWIKQSAPSALVASRK